VGGTIPVGDLLALLAETGFREATVVRRTGVATSPHTEGMELRAIRAG
jgi:hypothetical protein